MDPLPLVQVGKVLQALQRAAHARRRDLRTTLESGLAQYPLRVLQQAERALPRLALRKQRSGQRRIRESRQIKAADGSLRRRRSHAPTVAARAHSSAAAAASTAVTRSGVSK